MKDFLSGGWQEILSEEFEKPYFKNLEAYLEEESRSHTLFPPKEQRFRALEMTPYQGVKVLILGQDPYHQKDQANGLAFSVSSGVKPPPSLRNIYKELRDDLGGDIPVTGDLSPWAAQGVLLLNTVLTVRENEADSHKNQGWETFTDAIIKALSRREDPLVFILWGANARRKKSMITGHAHLVIEAPHPSPLSSYRGFFGSRPFSRANEFLESRGLAPIDWILKN